MVEEVRNHLNEMLESGTIRPSQSAWCNTLVLVWKKDGGLHFCIDFHHLNAHTKKGFLPPPKDTRGIREPGGHMPLFLPRSQIWILADKDGETSKQYTAFTVGNLGFFKCDWMPFELCNAPATFQQLMQNWYG